MTQTRWPSSARTRLARLLLWSASLIVPASRRDEWRQVWEGDLWTLVHERQPPGPGVWRFVTGSVPSAFAEWLAEWGPAPLLADAARGCRRLRSSRTHFLFAVLIVTVAISANTSIFTVVNATLLRVPPHVRGADRLVQIGREKADGDFDNLSYPNFADIQLQATTFSSLAAYGRASVLAQTPAGAMPLAVHAVTAGFFDVLGTAPALGRFFSDVEAAAPVAVISDALWRRGYQASPRVLGSTVHLDGAAFTIIGIAPRGFVGADVAGPPPDAWLPLHAYAAQRDSVASLDERGHSWLWVVGRLAPGASIGGARVALDVIHARLAAQHSGTLGVRFGIAPGVGLKPDERLEAQRVSALLMAVVGVVLLIAAANLAGLVTAQGARRSRDLSVCAAVGASSLRLTRELLAEQLAIAMTGATAAWCVTWWTWRTVQALLPYSFAITMEPDWRVFVFAVGVASITSLVFGVAPARRLSRLDVATSLRDSNPMGGAARGPSRWLAGAQLALSFALLIAAALLVRSVSHARTSNPGFAVDPVTAVRLNVDLARREGQVAAHARLGMLLDNVKRIPGVAGAAFASHPPLAVAQRTRSMRRRGEFTLDAPPTAALNVVSPEFFRALDIRLKRGRLFSDEDMQPGAPPRAVISEAAARTMFSGGDALGHQLEIGGTVEIIGVVGDVKLRSLADRHLAAVYLPLATEPPSELTLLVNGQPRIHPAALVDAVRASAPEFVVTAAAPLRDLLGRTYGETALFARLLTVFAVIAALLSAAGIYVVLAAWVSHHRRELAVRLAVGAMPSEIAWLVVRRITVPAGAGLMTGAVLAGAGTRALSGLLFGVDALDPVSYLAATGLLLVVTVLAGFAPARRAMRADPILTLKGV